MGKHGDTKAEIVKLIAKGDETLSSISEKLNLAPSTVSKHLQDLQARGVITQRENEHIKKWKYYALNSHLGRSDGVAGAASVGDSPLGKRVVLASLLVLLVAAVVVSVFYYNAKTQVASGSQPSALVVGGNTNATYVPISLTDPPKVPSGTSALYINYSSVSVTLDSNGVFSNVTINASGKIDVLSLVNVSQVIGTVAIKPGATLMGIVFNIDSASIVVDNTTYNVLLQNKQISAELVNNGRFNDSSGILLDFYPVVTPVYSQNATSFVMLASLRAAVVPNAYHANNGNLGYVSIRQPLPPSARQMFPDESQNVSITNVSLSGTSNMLSLTIKLMNRGSQNVTVFGVLVQFGGMVFAQGYRGNTGGKQWQGGMPPMPNANYTWNGSGQQGQPWSYIQANSTLEINTSRVNVVQQSGYGPVVIMLPRPASNVVLTSGMFGGGGPFMMGGGAAGMWLPIGFLVESNGTLAPMGMTPVGAQAGRAGYALAGMSSLTLSYTGQLQKFGAVAPNLTNGNYSVLILTSDGAVRSNTTAR